MSRTVVLVDAVRTPFGKAGGMYAGLSKWGTNSINENDGARHGSSFVRYEPNVTRQ